MTSMSLVGTTRTWRGVRVESVVRSIADVGIRQRTLPAYRRQRCAQRGANSTMDASKPRAIGEPDVGMDFPDSSPPRAANEARQAGRFFNGYGYRARRTNAQVHDRHCTATPRPGPFLPAWVHARLPF
jgi:hypothetical protein